MMDHGLAAVAFGIFYKVDSLALDKYVAVIARVLLDDGNRIVCPQFNSFGIDFTTKLGM